MKKYGHIKISRKAFDPVDGDVWWDRPRTFSQWEAWVYLIQLAQWAPRTLSTQYGPLDLGRGEFVASLRHLADDWKWGVQRVRTFLKEAKNLTRLIAQRETQAGTVYLIVNYDTYQGEGDEEDNADNTLDDTALTQRQHKNKQLSSKAVKKHVTSDNVTGDYPPEFELLWNAYPKRSGTNNKQAAYRQYLARLTEGVSFDAMHDGVLRYAAWATASGIVGQRVVLMAATFFGRDRHFLEPYDIPDAMPSDRNSVHHARATTLYGLYVQHGFSRVQSEDAYKQQVKHLAVSGTITEPRRFWAEMTAVKPWTWLGTVRSADKDRAIARIADVIAGVPAVLESHQGGAAAA